MVHTFLLWMSNNILLYVEHCVWDTRMMKHLKIMSYQNFKEVEIFVLEKMQAGYNGYLSYWRAAASEGRTKARKERTAAQVSEDILGRILCASELLPQHVVLVVKQRLGHCLLGICACTWSEEGFQCISVELFGKSTCFEVIFEWGTQFYHPPANYLSVPQFPHLLKKKKSATYPYGLL